SSWPADGAFTLLVETTDAQHPVRFRFSTAIDSTRFEIDTRLVVTPHFSYTTNFTPQFRVASPDWSAFQAAAPGCSQFLLGDPRLTLMPPQRPEDYVAFLVSDPGGVMGDLARRYPAQLAALRGWFYDPHQLMADVLAELYATGRLRFGAAQEGGPAVLSRTEGS